MDERRIPGWCALCRSRCGCISVVRDGRLVAVERNPEHPNRTGPLREGPGRPGARLQSRPGPASAEAHPCEGRSGPRLDPHRLGRSARPRGREAAGHRGHGRARGSRILDDHPERDLDLPIRCRGSSACCTRSGPPTTSTAPRSATGTRTTPPSTPSGPGSAPRTSITPGACSCGATTRPARGSPRGSG